MADRGARCQADVRLLAVGPLVPAVAKLDQFALAVGPLKVGGGDVVVQPIQRQVVARTAARTTFCQIAWCCGRPHPGSRPGAYHALALACTPRRHASAVRSSHRPPCKAARGACRRFSHQQVDDLAMRNRVLARTEPSTDDATTSRSRKIGNVKQAAPGLRATCDWKERAKSSAWLF